MTWEILLKRFVLLLENEWLCFALPVSDLPTIVKIMPLRKRLPASRRSHHVVVLAYENLCTFEFGIVVELFGLPRPELDAWYTFEVCGMDKKPLRATGGIQVLPQSDLGALRKADTIIIPGWSGPEVPVPDRLLQALLRAHRRGARIASICSGAFVLAASGLLDNRGATTHWRYADQMQRRFPAVRIDPRVLYVDDGDVLTSAGSAAGIDLCLHIIRKDFGASVANKVAKRLVVAPHREGGQAQFIDRAVGEAEVPFLSNLVELIQKQLHRPLPVSHLARLAHMSTRTLSRRFLDMTGKSPVEWVIDLRIARAKDLLEVTELAIEEVAERCGFGSAATLRHHFRLRVKTSPQEYRQQFSRNRA